MELLIAALVGIFVGAIAVGTFYASERDMRRVLPAETALPPEVVSLLTALPGSAIVLGADDQVLRAGASALALHLCDTNRITHPAVTALVARQRAEGSLVEDHITIGRSALENSSRIDLHIQVAPLAGGHVLILIEDETEVRRAEETRRDFIANISHELKTPVGAIALLSETLADSSGDEDAVQYFAHRLQRESKRLTNLVQDVIALSKLQDGFTAAKPELVHVQDIISEAIELCTTSAEAADINLISPVHPVEAVVLGSRDQLVTAVRNIIDNAIRYSPSKRDVTITTELDAEAKTVAIAVIDQGIGIDHADQERIFERFYRVDTARSRETGGTGLGLSIVKHVAIDHGGQVSVWSASGHGSTFTLTLPLAPTVSHEQLTNDSDTGSVLTSAASDASLSTQEV